MSRSILKLSFLALTSLTLGCASSHDTQDEVSDEIYADEAGGSIAEDASSDFLLETLDPLTENNPEDTAAHSLGDVQFEDYTLAADEVAQEENRPIAEEPPIPNSDYLDSPMETLAATADSDVIITDELIDAEPIAAFDDDQRTDLQSEQRQAVAMVSPEDTQFESDLSNKHIVRAGDTLASIAARYLGSSSRWREIAELNQTSNANLIYPGDLIALPSGARTAPVYERKVIEVSRGDTLAGIAEQTFGDADAWKIIWRLNRDLIENPNRIRAGMKLTVYSSRKTAAY
jgi:nucleoid-associated protein YgaU